MCVFETTITDDGKGIKKERLPYLFKIFGELKNNLELQIDQDIKDNGIGVGLSCSKIIANALGGDVTFVPNDQEKTMLSVTLKVKTYE